MKLTKTRLKQIIKEELQTALREEDDKIAAILSEFTPEEQEILQKDLNSRGSKRSLEDAVEMYLYNPDFGEDKIIEVMRLIVKYGSYDAVIAAEKKVKDEWTQPEMERLRDLERKGVDPSRIYSKTPPWQSNWRVNKKAYPALAAQDLGII